MTSIRPFGYEYGARPSSMTAAQLERLRTSSVVAAPDPHPVVLSDALAVRGERRVLVLLEAVNAGGKDGTLEGLSSLTDLEPMRVERIKRPVPGVLPHDLLKTATPLLPAPGELVFFNRSYYEGPVHAAAHGTPIGNLCRRIVAFEDRLAREDVCLVKLFLHIDREEQQRRLEDRTRHLHLRHLHNPFDHHDQENWTQLMRAYDSVLALTHTRTNPWSMIPANDRAYRNRAVAEVLTHALTALSR